MAKERFITKLFNDGHERCNRLGLRLAKGYYFKMLDAGYGDGKIGGRFARNALLVYGMDLVPKERDYLDARSYGDLNKDLPYNDRSFDFILASQSIEHLYNTRYFLEECYRILKYNGRLLILTENLASWVNIFSLIMGWTPFSLTNTDGWNIGNPIMKRDETKEPDYLFQEANYRNSGVVGHVRVMTYDGVRDIMSRVGFKTRIYTRGYLPFWGWLSDLLCMMDRKHGHFLIALGEK